MKKHRHPGSQHRHEIGTTWGNMGTSLCLSLCFRCVLSLNRCPPGPMNCDSSHPHLVHIWPRESGLQRFSFGGRRAWRLGAPISETNSSNLRRTPGKHAPKMREVEGSCFKYTPPHSARGSCFRFHRYKTGGLDVLADMFWGDGPPGSV